MDTAVKQKTRLLIDGINKIFQAFHPTNPVYQQKPLAKYRLLWL